MVPEPPLSREEAEAIVGPIGARCWQRIRRAFEAYHCGRADLERSKESEFRKQKAETLRDLDHALDRLAAGGRDRRRLLREATELWRQKQHDAPDLEAMIAEAAKMLRAAHWYLEMVEPDPETVQSDAQLRAALAREIAAALEECGAGFRLSDGRALDDPSEADLTAFERLALAMGVHEGTTPEASARWLRGAMGQNP